MLTLSGTISPGISCRVASDRAVATKVRDKRLNKCHTTQVRWPVTPCRVRRMKRLEGQTNMEGLEGEEQVVDRIRIKEEIACQSTMDHLKDSLFFSLYCNRG